MDKYAEMIYRHRAEETRVISAMESKQKKLDMIFLVFCIILFFSLIYISYHLLYIHLESEKLKQWLETH